MKEKKRERFTQAVYFSSGRQREREKLGGEQKRTRKENKLSGRMYTLCRAAETNSPGRPRWLEKLLDKSRPKTTSRWECHHFAFLDDFSEF